ncbi:MAG: XdhC family protein [Blautia sp.]
MNQFYNQLAEKIRENTAEFWSETVLEEAAGEKHILVEAPEGSLPSVVTEDASEYTVRESEAAKAVYLRWRACIHADYPIGKMIRFTVTVLEDRPKFADNARAAGADRVSVNLETVLRGSQAMRFLVCIVTRGHRYDTECLECILRKRHAYVGMMGRRRAPS